MKAVPLHRRGEIEHLFDLEQAIPVRLVPVVDLRLGLCLSGYVIGGELRANQADAPIVQQIDLNTHVATVVGHLAAGLSHAVATAVKGTRLVDDVGSRTRLDVELESVGCVVVVPAGR